MFSPISHIGLGIKFLQKFSVFLHKCVGFVYHFQCYLRAKLVQGWTQLGNLSTAEHKKCHKFMACLFNEQLVCFSSFDFLSNSSLKIMLLKACSNKRAIGKSHNAKGKRKATDSFVHAFWILVYCKHWFYNRFRNNYKLWHQPNFLTLQSFYHYIFMKVWKYGLK